ncbi:MAG: GlxA family transcriptional regulator, partial [Kordiimonas sp.]
MESLKTQQSIAVILYDLALPLDIAGPTDAFTGANQYWRTAHNLETDHRYYKFLYISADDRVIKTKSGLKITADALLSETSPTDYDVILVPGGDGVFKALKNTALIEWMKTAYLHSKRTMSVCSGAALLAEAGLLTGKKACSHWFSCERLQAKYPNVNFDPASLYISDGKIITSAGVTSGIDMALAVIEADMGRTAALEVARHLVVHLKRAGNQQQFSGPLKAQLK